MPVFVNGETVYYYIQEDPIPEERQSENPQEQQDLLRNELDKEVVFANLIKTAFDTWPQDTINMIKDSDREKEFSDITPLLEQKVNLHKVGKKEEADIVFRFSDINNVEKKCGFNADGCMSITKSNRIYIYTINPYIPNGKSFEKRKNDVQSILIHEVGHYFGLSDQYKSDYRTSKKHSTPNRIGKYDSVMAASNDLHLGCDDADGFINLLDYTIANGDYSYSARANYGWDSLCNKQKNGLGDQYEKIRYARAEMLNRPLEKDNIGCINQYDNNGNVIYHICPPSLPFDFYNQKLYYNNYGLISRKEDGNVIYTYSYKLGKDNTPVIEVAYSIKSTSANAQNIPFKETFWLNKYEWPLSKCYEKGANIPSRAFWVDNSPDYPNEYLYIHYDSCDIESDRMIIFFNENRTMTKSFHKYYVPNKKIYWGVVKYSPNVNPYSNDNINSVSPLYESEPICELFISKKYNGSERNASIGEISAQTGIRRELIEEDLTRICNSNEEIKFKDLPLYFMKVNEYYGI